MSPPSILSAILNSDTGALVLVILASITMLMMILDYLQQCMRSHITATDLRSHLDWLKDLKSRLEYSENKDIKRYVFICFLI